MDGFTFLIFIYRFFFRQKKKKKRDPENPISFEDVHPNES